MAPSRVTYFSIMCIYRVGLPPFRCKISGRSWFRELRRRSIPIPSRLGGLQSVVSSPSGFWGGAPAESDFSAFLTSQNSSRCNLCCNLRSCQKPSVNSVNSVNRWFLTGREKSKHGKVLFHVNLTGNTFTNRLVHYKFNDSYSSFTIMLTVILSITSQLQFGNEIQKYVSNATSRRNKVGNCKKLSAV